MLLMSSYKFMSISVFKKLLNSLEMLYYLV